jgi:hypothetical protein
LTTANINSIIQTIRRILPVEKIVSLPRDDIQIMYQINCIWQMANKANNKQII